jgi:mannose-6-phosphate isomerase-like protein (cupin superfamily)
MRHKQLDFTAGFQVVINSECCQAAEMVLEAGESTGGKRNRHVGSDQWLFVVSGTGEATVDGRPLPLQSGDLLLIEHREFHEIRNTGEAPLRTLNLYVPPAYTKDGDELPAGRAN